MTTGHFLNRNFPYYFQNLDNNIAIIRIPMVSCSSSNVCAVCLNSFSEDVETLSTLFNCYITGWGSPAKAAKATTVLQQARVRILHMSECLQRFAVAGISDVELPPSAFCAEGADFGQQKNSNKSSKAMSTCGGDGGGPLVSWKFTLRLWKRPSKKRDMKWVKTVGVPCFKRRVHCTLSKVPNVYRNASKLVLETNKPTRSRSPKLQFGVRTSLFGWTTAVITMHAYSDCFCST